MKSLSWIATTEKKWIEKWDKIQTDSSQGVFTQTSSWQMSYKPYGFDFTLFIGVDESEEIRAGFSCLLVKLGPFRVVNCTWGPYSDGSVDWETAIVQLKIWAKNQSALALQLNFAAFEKESESDLYFIDYTFKKGNLLNKIYAPTHFNWINLPAAAELDWEKLLLKSFSENARRNIKSGLKNQVIMEQVQSPKDLRKAYQCFEDNADREGYHIRDWVDLKESLIAAMELGQSLFFLAKSEGKILGAIWAAKGGSSLHYIMGGVERTEKDLKIGHLLQWEMMKASINLGYEKYNISVGGSEGVVRFKGSFYPHESHSFGIYHEILIPWKYKIFQSAYKFAERNKKMASKILKLVR